MKGLLKWCGILIGVLVLLIIAASVVVMLVVDKEMIAGKMEPVLHRHVTIDAIDIGLFSVVSGIEVAGVKISNYKTPDQLVALEGKPVSDNDLFAALKSLSLKLKVLPLLSGSVQVGEFVLYEPVIHVVKYKNGTFNFSDLLKSEKEKEETKPSEPFSADDLPVSLTLGKIGVEQGMVTYLDKRDNRTLQIYDLTFLAYSASIDPSQLEKKNEVKIKLETGIKPKERWKTGAVEYFDIGLAAKGSVKPFDVKTRLLDPEVTLEVESPNGTLSGVKILEAIQSVKAIEQYTGKLSFLQDEVTWKEADMEVWYKAGNAKVSMGRIEGEDYNLDFSGATNMDTKAIDLDLGMELGEEPSQALKASIEKKMKQELKGDVGKYVSSEQLADLVMKRLTNEDGNVFLKYKVTGTTTSPKPTLVEPSVPPLQALLREMGGDVADIAKEAAKKEGQKAIDDATKQLGDDLRKKFKF
jgi:uncharacterized protein involved in outer membrane biogenesis